MRKIQAVKPNLARRIQGRRVGLSKNRTYRVAGKTIRIVALIKK